MIQNKTYKLGNLNYLTNKTVVAYINKFWSDVYSKITGAIGQEKYLMILLKIHINEDELGYRTIGHLRKVRIEDKDLFIDYINDSLENLRDSYSTVSIDKITFSYIVKEGLPMGDRLLLQPLNKQISWHRFNNMDLPITMVPSEYGIIKSVSTHPGFTKYIVINDKYKVFEIDVLNNGLQNKITLLNASNLKWTDTKISEVSFMREIQKSTIYFKEGEIILRKQVLPAKPIERIKKDPKIVSNFVTMDIETFKNASDKLIPYAICATNGTDTISSFSTNENILFNSFMSDLLGFFKNQRKMIVYAHNLSGFDGIFLMKHLLEFGDVKPLVFNGRLMSITLTLNIFGHQRKTIVFKDSYLILSQSLRKLCKIYNVETSKTYFPVRLNNILYKGALPAMKYWNIGNEEYEVLVQKYLNKEWSFKDEAIKYCKVDCISLHQVLTKFNLYVYNEFQINIHSVLTAPSLAMRIYKSGFLPENKIYQLLGAVEHAIRESYSGGAVDVYIPHNRTDNFFSEIYKKLYYYDVNSLYPFIMANHLMPVGQPIAFEGDIRKVEPNAFGFFYCKITSPDYLENPILQRRIRTSEGIRTIAGLGSWEGWYNSVDIDNAIKHSYKIEIIKGYQFETGDVFSEYINKMYNIRMLFIKGDPMNDIAKLLMNSLYGKFGMKSNVTKLDIFKINDDNSRERFHELLEFWGESVHNWLELDNHIFIIRDTLLPLKYNLDENYYHGADINIAIASTITTAARVYMSDYKNNPNYKIYYSDTDSIIIDAPLPAHLVGTALGQFKLEHVIKRAVFLAPKVYGLITENDEEIIKVKGIKSDIVKDLTFKDLEALLIKDSSREFTLEKWMKNILLGTISVKDIAYTLRATSNKRAQIFDNGIYTATRPYNYNEIEIRK